MNVSNKVSLPALAGAVTILIVYGLSFVNIVPSAEVSSAFTLIVMSVLGYIVPHGGDGA